MTADEPDDPQPCDDPADAVTAAAPCGPDCRCAPCRVERGIGH